MDQQHRRHEVKDTDVAIIGMACRFPGQAKNVEQFFAMLRDGGQAHGPIPEHRFDLNAYHHPQKGRTDSIIFDRACFLKDDVWTFDTAFFSVIPSEASAIDPQHRLLLEVAYEALEDSGTSLEAVRGTSMGCFVGCMSSEYEHALIQDHTRMPRSAVANCIFRGSGANRVSRFFDIRGPSITIDTACSSSLIALTQACASLLSPNSTTKAAFVGGSSLMLSPVLSTGFNANHLLSPEGESRTFDARANGLGRGEGVGMLVIKRASDAIQDGDSIRALICGTHLNQDGQMDSFGAPNAESQVRLIQETYRTFGIDHGATAFAELHGTGTAVGDPVEISAVGSVLAMDREEPLFCGAVKANIGHLDGAAGIASVIKAVLSVERGLIFPQPNLVTLNPKLDLRDNMIAIPTAVMAWPNREVRQCSVSSFGFGGSNAHAVLRAFDRKRAFQGNLSKDEDWSHQSTLGAPYDPSPSHMCIFSAPTQTGLQDLCELFGQRLSRGALRLSDMAYTLNRRYSMFPWRFATVAGGPVELQRALSSLESKSLSKTAAIPKLAFIFTGQGAQWFAMGRELLAREVFYRSILAGRDTLLRLGAPWDALNELLADNENSNVNKIDYAQPLTMLVQLALVDLLRHWGIRPSVVLGHSSGEAAAAYAAGLLSQEDCLRITFHRGLVLALVRDSEAYGDGAMMAVALSADRAQQYLTGWELDRLVIGCINSPSSVTVSGDRAQCLRLKDALDHDNVSSQLLKMEVASHSPQMEGVLDEYEKALSELKDRNRLHANDIHMFSCTTAQRVDEARQLDGKHWSRHLRSVVRFTDALDSMFAQHPDTDVVVEIGPHSALGSPLRQYCGAKNLSKQVSYQSALSRGKSASFTMLRLVSALWMQGTPVDLFKVNATEAEPQPGIILHDLPSYPWNHNTRYVQRTNRIQDFLFPRHPRHDLLGHPAPCFNTEEPQWRNTLKVDDLPWLNHHVVKGQVILPAAAMIVMVMEAAAMIVDDMDDVEKITISDLRITSPLVVPDDSVGIDTILSLRPAFRSLDPSTKEFTLYSHWIASKPTQHASGTLDVIPRESANDIDGDAPSRSEQLSRLEFVDRVRREAVLDGPVDEFYDSCYRSGIDFGPTFRGLRSILYGQRPGRAGIRGTCFSESKVEVLDIADLTGQLAETDYMLHPATLDSCFQGAFAALRCSDTYDSSTWMPTAFEQVTFFPGASFGNPRQFECYTQCKYNERTEVSILVQEPCEKGAVRPRLSIRNATFTKLEPSRAERKQLQQQLQVRSKIVSAPKWLPDINMNDAGALQSWCQVRESSHVQGFYDDFRDAIGAVANRILAQLGDVEVQDLKSHFKRYVSMLRSMREVLEPGNNAAPEAENWTSNSLATRERRALACLKQSCLSVGTLLEIVSENFFRIASGQASAVEMIAGSEAWTKLYFELPGSEASAQHITRWLELFCHKRPGVSVLEVGAGTASSALPVLRHLGSGAFIREYTFTDISTFWFPAAQELLAAWRDKVAYLPLDIEAHLSEQGFVEEKYDVVIAVNVLHATKDIGRALDNCYRLLKPGGKLLLGEIFHNSSSLPHPVSSITGVLEGWWLSQDARAAGPLLSRDMWHRRLLQAGFTGLDIVIYDHPSPEARYTTISTSTKPVRFRGFPFDHVTILVEDGEGELSQSVATRLAERIRDVGLLAEIATMPPTPRQWVGRCVISLLDFDKCYLSGANDTRFGMLTSVLQHAGEVLWVSLTSRAVPESCFVHQISGLLRSATVELPSSRLHELHLVQDFQNRDAMALAECIVRKLQTYNQDRSTALAESQVVEDGPYLMIPRLLPCDNANDFIVPGALDRDTKTMEKTLLHQEHRSFELIQSTPGIIDGLHFAEFSPPTGSLDHNEVEVEHRCVALNFRDVLIALGLLHGRMGWDISGVVTDVGSGVSSLQKGDRVMALKIDALRTKSRGLESTFCAIPDNMSFETAASMPLVFSVARKCLLDGARLQSNESILIHSASGGFGQACIQIARQIGATIYCTVGSVAKKTLLVKLGVPETNIYYSRSCAFAELILDKTKGYGVDVIVSSLSGKAIESSFHCLALNGRLLSTTVTDIRNHQRLDLSTMGKGAHFITVFPDPQDHGDAHIEMCSWISSIVGGFATGALVALEPIHVYDASEIVAAFQAMQQEHLGKIVVRFDKSSEVMASTPRQPRASYDPRATYLLAGGLGGLCRGLAMHMARNGARYLAFISRSGPTSLHANVMKGELDALGVKAVIVACDISDSLSLEAALETIRAEVPPIRGVVNAAMVLNDCLFSAMSFEAWQTAIRPKVQGSWNLHAAFDSSETDFFIMLSSLAGVVGNAGQANYAAGCSFQDALAHHRRRQGLSGCSIDLGVIRDLGYARVSGRFPTMPKILRQLALNSDEFYEIIDYVVHSARHQSIPQLILGASTGGIEKLYESGAADSERSWWLHSRPEFAYLNQLDRDVVPLNYRHQRYQPPRVEKAQAQAQAQQPEADREEFTARKPDVQDRNVITRSARKRRPIDTGRIAPGANLEAIESAGQGPGIPPNSTLSRLLAVVHRQTALPTSDIDVSRSFTQYGIDSLVAVELVRKIHVELGATSTTGELLNANSIEEFANSLELGTRI